METTAMKTTYEEATWAEVRAAPDPGNKPTHEEMVVAVASALEEAGLEPSGRAYLMPHRESGACNLAAFWDADGGALCLTHWHTKEIGSVLYGGLRSRPGSPAVYLSEYPLGRAGGSLGNVAPAVRAWLLVRSDYEARVRALSRERLGDGAADSYVIRAGRHLLIAWSRLRDVLHHYDAGPQTRWGLLEAFARASDKSTPLDRARCIYEFSGVLLGRE